MKNSLQILDVTDRRAQVIQALNRLADVPQTRSTVYGDRSDMKWIRADPDPFMIFAMGFMVEPVLESNVEDHGCGPVAGYAVGRLHIGTVAIPSELMAYARRLEFDRETSCFIDRETLKALRHPSGLILKDNLHSLYLP